MEKLLFIKFGGSLITDKRQRYVVRDAVLQRLARELARALSADPSLRLVLGHGSGSFGHVAARESGYDPEAGHTSPLALAQVGAAAAELNRKVRAALLAAGVPALSLPPSASAYLQGSLVRTMALQPFKDLLELGAVPLTYGDVALREEGGAAIASTEALFRYLAEHLQPQRVLLLGIVEGVFERVPVAGEVAPPLIEEITPATWEAVRQGLGASHGTDVTGGMVSKVEETLALVQAVPSLQARIVNGEEPLLLERLLLDPALTRGTLIHAG